MFKCKHEWRFDHSNDKGNWLQCRVCGNWITEKRLNQLHHALDVKRMVRNGRRERQELTKQQQNTVDYLRRTILARENSVSDIHEYKQFEVRVDHGLVFVLSEVGLKNDEGTMASVFARTRRHIMIGAHGGMTLLNAKSNKKVTGAAVLYTVTV